VHADRRRADGVPHGGTALPRRGDIPLTVRAPAERHACAEAMAAAMEQEPGVRSAVLDAKEGTLRLHYDPRRVSLARVQRRAKQLGLELDRSFASCTLRLHGMRCADCTQQMAERLRRVPGIARVSINPTAEVIGIEHEAEAAELPAVEERLSRAGYQVQPPPASRAAFRAAERRERGVRMRMAALTALCLAGLLGGLALQAAGAPRAFMLAWWAAACVAGGWYSAGRVVRGLRSGSINVDLLMIAAALGAAAIGEWPEGLTLLFLFALSNTLEAWVLGRTRRAIEALMDLAPEEAVVRRDGAEVRLPVEDLVPGDVIVVRPGERIAADGTVAAGSTAVDQSPVTGESMPVERSPGDPVFAGTLNRHGAVEIEVTRRAADATLARMVRLVEEAQAERARAQRFTDWFGQRYTIGVLAAAALTGAVPIVFLGEAFAEAFYRAMTVLVVASPCAVVISIPSAILSAITAAARGGVLFKGGAHLERAATVRLIAFDKTGTLTVGRPRVIETVAAEGWSRDRVLAVAAAAESLSEHPLARAIVDAARARRLASGSVAEARAIVGRGLEALVDGRRVLAGKPELLAEHGVAIPRDLDEAAARLRAAGRTVIFVAEGGRAAGAVAIADTLRPGAAEAMERLRRLGIGPLIMLTGDNEAVAANIAGTLGIEFQAQLMPEQKLQAIRELRERHGTVAMVGDGINDAPSLAAADLGISMGGSATDVALETADVVLMADELRHLPWAISLSRAARRIILQNLLFAFGVMAVLLGITLAGRLPLPLAVAGHEGSTVLVILNGLRLLGFRRDAVPAPPGIPSAG
jgi:Cd2+/Zn2+-exporting ATPase